MSYIILIGYEPTALNKPQEKCLTLARYYTPRCPLPFLS